MSVGEIISLMRGAVTEIISIKININISNIINK